MRTTRALSGREREGVTYTPTYLSPAKTEVGLGDLSRPDAQERWVKGTDVTDRPVSRGVHVGVDGGGTTPTLTQRQRSDLAESAGATLPRSLGPGVVPAPAGPIHPGHISAPAPRPTGDTLDGVLVLDEEVAGVLPVPAHIHPRVRPSARPPVATADTLEGPTDRLLLTSLSSQECGRGEHLSVSFSSFWSRTGHPCGTRYRTSRAHGGCLVWSSATSVVPGSEQKEISLRFLCSGRRAHLRSRCFPTYT